MLADIQIVESTTVYPDKHNIAIDTPRPSIETGGFHASASFTSLQDLNHSPIGIKRTFSDNVLTSLAQPSAAVPASMQDANLEMFRRASRHTKKQMTVVGYSEVQENDSTRSNSLESRKKEKGSGMFKLFGRKPTISKSRPASPTRSRPAATAIQPPKSRNASPSKLSIRSVRSVSRPEPALVTRSADDQVGRLRANDDDAKSIRSFRSSRSTRSVRKGVSPTPTSRSNEVSETSTESSSDSSYLRPSFSKRSSFSSINSRTSNEKLSLKVPHKVPPLPTTFPNHFSHMGSDPTQKRDPLWTQFRQLEGEQTQFAVKTGLLKAKSVRTVLIPFFNKCNDADKVHLLRAEDLDRRINILAKWWTCLMDLLTGPQQHSVSNTDRPAFLDAITDIMMRAEWRVPVAEEIKAGNHPVQDDISKTASNSSTDGEDPEFVTASVHQKITSLFVKHLQLQIAYVVDKLSIRSAPASLVTFAGKTCAYAFFFCPGTADLLTALWHIPLGTIRRLFAEFEPDSARRAGPLSRLLARSFPAPIRSLAFSSTAALSKQIQAKPQIPPGMDNVRWYGPWENRWVGRDSDLFFVFVRYYHVLVLEHLPRSLMPDERLAVPGLAVVHAQLLLNLESTLYRQAGRFHEEAYTGENPDSLATMPMVVPNATRTIGENRIVIMIRELSNDRRLQYQHVADTVVSSFQYIMKAATRKISMFNNDACFVLADFLEELLPIVACYQRTHTEAEDWNFWFKVFQQLLLSQTTMIQIRVLAFLFSMWNVLANTEARKRQMTIEWLLKPQFFAQHFNHWSPMVRHYYFRLLCWRIGRCNGSPTETDVEIYTVLQSRLYLCHAHHSYLTNEAEANKVIPPAATPCLPAPGRILLIIRTDDRNRSFATLEKFGARDKSPYITATSATSSIPTVNVTATIADKKPKWSLLKSISLFSGPGNERPGEVTPPRSPTVHSADKKSFMESKDSLSARHRPMTPPFQASSFRFSLEHNNARPELPTKMRRLPNPQLPHTSQKVINDMESEAGRGSSSTTSTSPSGKASSPLSDPSNRIIKPVKPSPEEAMTARYSGRALAEWQQVISECRNFYTRRKQEGCPNDKLIETPVLAVESFRMFG